MKKTAILITLLALVSCTEKYISQDLNVYVAPQGRCIFTASVTPLSGTWTWSAASSAVGVYGNGVSNARYQPRAAFDGATGTAEIFGEGVVGQAYAYMPYTSEGLDAAAKGCTPLPKVQKYCNDAVSQIESNCILVAAAGEDGLFDFRYPCGTLHLQIKINFEEHVQRVNLSANEPLCGWLDVMDGSMVTPYYTVSVTGIDKACTESKPLDVWIMLPEGTYTGLYVTVAGKKESISTVVEGTFNVPAGGECIATARENNNNYSGTDFEGEEVDYD